MINQILLCSKSSRRKHFLQFLELPFICQPSEINEKKLKNENQTDYLTRIVHEKAYQSCKIFKKNNSQSSFFCYIAADTVVILNSKIIGKPGNREKAIKTLQMLSGKMHIVQTILELGINTQSPIYIHNHEKIENFLDESLIPKKTSIITEYKSYIHIEKTLVSFNQLDNNQIKEYINQFNPLDKAGSYGIQDNFPLIRSYNGSLSNVIGLPLRKILFIVPLINNSINFFT
jgi:septum formation protein